MFFFSHEASVHDGAASRFGSHTFFSRKFCLLLATTHFFPATAHRFFFAGFCHRTATSRRFVFLLSSVVAVSFILCLLRIHELK
jgi:hypothetical protein